MRRVVAAACGLALLAGCTNDVPTLSEAEELAPGELSEPGGYFDTDNLVSNERSYLHVAPDLLALRSRGRGVRVS